MAPTTYKDEKELLDSREGLLRTIDHPASEDVPAPVIQIENFEIGGFLLSRTLMPSAVATRTTASVLTWFFGLALVVSTNCVTRGGVVAAPHVEAVQWVDGPPLKPELNRGCMRIMAIDGGFPANVGLVVRGPDVEECGAGDSYEIETLPSGEILGPVRIEFRHRIEASAIALFRAGIDGGTRRSPSPIMSSRARATDGGIIGRIGAQFEVPGRFFLHPADAPGSPPSNRIEDYFRSTLEVTKLDAGAGN